MSINFLNLTVGLRIERPELANVLHACPLLEKALGAEWLGIRQAQDTIEAKVYV